MAGETTNDPGEKVLAGILLTMVAYMLFTVHDAAVKLLVAGFSVWEILFFRSLTILACCMAAGGGRLVGDTLRSRIVLIMFLRSFLNVTAWICFYNAARTLGLAELTTIYYAAPVIVTVLSIVVLGERVPAGRWAAVLVGFAGVFVACNPARLGLSPPILLVLAAAFLWALSVVLLRKVALQERTLVQMVLNNVFTMAECGVALAFVWRTPDAAQIGLMLLAGLLAGSAQFCLFEGFKRAPASTIAPLEYTALIWAFALGYAIWGDVPRSGVFAGAALIVGAGLIIVAGERRRGARS